MKVLPITTAIILSGWATLALAESDQQRLFDDFAQTATEIPSSIGTAMYGDSLRWSRHNDILNLMRECNNLNPRILRTGNPRQKGLAIFLYGYGDDASYVGDIGALLDDKNQTIPQQQLIEGMPPQPQLLGEWARQVLAQRLGTSMNDPALRTSASFAAYWKTVKDPDQLPSEWIFRFGKADCLGEKTDAIKTRLEKVDPKFRALIIASIYASQARNNPDHTIYDEAHALDALTKGLGGAAMRSLLDASAHFPGINLRCGPDSTGYPALRRFILDHATTLFTKEDAGWLRSLGRTDRNIYAVIAAARLDPAHGEPLLANVLRSEGDQSAKTDLLQALWDVAGEKDQKAICDAYYAEAVPKYNIGGLQEDFVDRIAGEGNNGKPMLNALIADARFSTLGWAATRAFARHCDVILGSAPKEATDYLALQHPIGEYEFEHALGRRKDYPDATQKILDATAEFQKYLSGRVGN